MKGRRIKTKHRAQTRQETSKRDGESERGGGVSEKNRALKCTLTLTNAILFANELEATQCKR